MKIIFRNDFARPEAEPIFWFKLLLEHPSLFNKDTELRGWNLEDFQHMGYGYKIYHSYPFSEVYFYKEGVIYTPKYDEDLRVDQTFIEYFIKNKDLIRNYDDLFIKEIPNIKGEFSRILRKEVFVYTKKGKTMIYAPENKELFEIFKDVEISWLK